MPAAHSSTPFARFSSLFARFDHRSTMFLVTTTSQLLLLVALFLSSSLQTLAGPHTRSGDGPAWETEPHLRGRQLKLALRVAVGLHHSRPPFNRNFRIAHVAWASRRSAGLRSEPGPRCVAPRTPRQLKLATASRAGLLGTGWGPSAQPLRPLYIPCRASSVPCHMAREPTVTDVLPLRSSFRHARQSLFFPEQLLPHMPSLLLASAIPHPITLGSIRSPP